MFYSNSCMQYIASGTLLTTHINATNEKKKKKCNREDALQQDGSI